MDLDNKDTPKDKSNIIKSLEKGVKYLNFGLIVLIIGLLGFYIYKNSNQIIDQPKNESAVSGVNTSTSKKTIIADISGAVAKPGVYELDEGSRIVDLIEKAGGFSERVDLEQVEKSINKAQKLVDSQKVYIPRVGETLAVVPTNTTNSPINTSGKVNINSASRQSLIDLPEIGESTADKIINARPYSATTDLVKKGVLRQSSFDKIKDRLEV